MGEKKDNWFEGITNCVSCDSENLSIEIRGKREVLICTDCGFPNAGQPVGE